MAEIREATWDDFEAVVDLLDARSTAVFGNSEIQAAHVRQRWELPGAGPGWVAEEGGAIVGHAALDATQDVAAAFTDDAVGDALLAQVVRQARARGFDFVALTAVEHDVPLSDLVHRSGFELDREILRMWRSLERDLPEPRWPNGVVVRTYEDRDGEHVHRLLDEMYGDWDPDYVSRDHPGWLALMTAHDEFDPALWFLVERDDVLVACALHWKESQERGWVKDIVVAPSERGRGIGRALLEHAFRVYGDRGAKRVGLKVDSNNPTGAVELYERTGFVTDQRYGIWTLRL